MVRSDTRGIVAGMQHPQAFRDRAVVEFPGEPMGCHIPPVHPKPTVTPSNAACRPDPAVSEVRPVFRDRPVLIYALPKPLSIRSPFIGQYHARLSAKRCLPVLQLRRCHKERHATCAANAFHFARPPPCGILSLHVVPPYDVPRPRVFPHRWGIFL